MRRQKTKPLQWDKLSYGITATGEVISWKRGLPRSLSPFRDSGGYWCVRLWHHGVRKGYRVHRLVCEHFHGPPPSPLHCVRHLNGVQTDCHKDNLAWGTPAENCADIITHRKGRKCRS